MPYKHVGDVYDVRKTSVYKHVPSGGGGGGDNDGCATVISVVVILALMGFAPLFNH